MKIFVLPILTTSLGFCAFGDPASLRDDLIRLQARMSVGVTKAQLDVSNVEIQGHLIGLKNPSAPAAETVKDVAIAIQATINIWEGLGTDCRDSYSVPMETHCKARARTSYSQLNLNIDDVRSARDLVPNAITVTSQRVKIAIKATECLSFLSYWTTPYCIKTF